MFKGLLSFLRCLILHIGIALGQVGVDTIHGHINHLDLAIDREDLLDMFLNNVSRQPPQINLGRFGCRAPTSSVPVILLC